MLICKRCGDTIDEDDLGYGYEPHGEISDDCCSCGGEYGEAEKCAACDEWFDNSYGYGVCEDCMKACETVGMALLIGQDNTETCEINGFAASVLSKEQINQILEKWVEENFTDGSKAVREYLYRDKGCFAQYVESERDNGKVWRDG